MREDWQTKNAQLQKDISKDQLGVFAEALQDADVSVTVSERDRDPYGVLISKEEMEEDS